jgi:hypothetical protein
MAGEAHAYGTLEAVHPGCLPYRQEYPFPSDAGKQVVPDYGKQPVIYNKGSHGIEVAAKDDSFAQGVGGHHVPAPRASRRRLLIIGGAIALAIILAAVLGGVFGSRKSSHSATASTTPTRSPPNSSATTIPVQRNIAAVSYSSNSVNNTRVYYQDDLGQLMESANTADNATWSISGTGTFGMNGSAIAAAVSRPKFYLASLLSRNPLS